eukprot:gene2497-2737_t
MLTNFFFALLQVSLALAAATTATQTYRLKEINYHDLAVGKLSVAQAAVEALTEVGALQITDIPNFAKARKEALGRVAECYKFDDKASRLVMSDGARRYSSGAASHRGVPEAMSSPCGNDAAHLRAAVDDATSQLFHAFDLVVSKKSEKKADANVMEPSYSNFVDLMAVGEHLEHLHTYYSGDDATLAQAISPATVNYHVDSGLMIAMTTGYYAPTPATEASGLYMELADGQKVKVLADDDSLIILMADGAASWLAPVFGRPLYAPSHALFADLPANGQASRSWYGKMYLPPADAVIPHARMPFARYHSLATNNAASLTTATQNSEDRLVDLLPSACGRDSSRYLAVVATTCTEDKIYCWMSCMSISSLSCGADQYPVCWNSATNVTVDGAAHCPKTCKPGCHTTQAPTLAPSSAPTISIAPTVSPTDAPTYAPSLTPTLSPSDAPTVAPTVAPSNAPTLSPTNAPTFSAAPTLVPTNAPTLAPSDVPTFAPSDAPTLAPTNAPTLSPTARVADIVKFDASFTMTVANSTVELTDKEQSAVRTAVAVVCNTSVDNVVYNGYKLAASAVAVALRIQSSGSIVVAVTINVNMVNYATSTPEEVYNEYKTTLSTAVGSGSLVNFLKSAGTEVGTSYFNNVAVNSVVTSGYEVVEADDDDHHDEYQVTKGQMAGLIVGTICGTLILMGIVYAYLAYVARKPSSAALEK